MSRPKEAAILSLALLGCGSSSTFEPATDAMPAVDAADAATDAHADAGPDVEPDADAAACLPLACAPDHQHLLDCLGHLASACPLGTVCFMTAVCRPAVCCGDPGFTEVCERGADGGAASPLYNCQQNGGTCVDPNSPVSAPCP